jgi:hypothetical protein
LKNSQNLCTKCSTWFCQFSSIILSNSMSLYYCRTHKKIINWNEYVSVPIKILKIKSILFNKFFYISNLPIGCVKIIIRRRERNNKLFIHRMSCHYSYENFINIIYWYSFRLFSTRISIWLIEKERKLKKVVRNAERIEFNFHYFFVSIKMNLIKYNKELRMKVLCIGNDFVWQFFKDALK